MLSLVRSGWCWISPRCCVDVPGKSGRVCASWKRRCWRTNLSIRAVSWVEESHSRRARSNPAFRAIRPAYEGWRRNRGKPDQGDCIFSRLRPSSHPSWPSLANGKRSVYVPVETNDKLANDMGIPEELDKVLERLSSARSPSVANLKVVQFSFEALNGTVSHFQILVESIAFRDELRKERHEYTGRCDKNRTDMLFPLPEPSLLALDLLGEAFAEGFLFLFEFGIVRLLHSRLAEFPGLHLLLTVVLIVDVFSRGDQVKHVRANQARPQLPEIAVILVLDCGGVVLVSLSRKGKHSTYPLQLPRGIPVP